MATGLRVRKEGLDPNDIREGVNQFDVCVECIRIDKDQPPFFDITGYGGAWENQITNLYKEDEYHCDFCDKKLTTISKKWWKLVDQSLTELIV